MTLTYLGGQTIGSCIPTALAATAELDLSIGIMLPELQVRLAAMLEIQASISITPPSLALSLQAALDLVVALRASIALSIELQLPAVNVDLSIMLKVIAEINLFLGQLTASLAFSASLKVALGHAGIHLYRYEGAAGPLIGTFPGGTAQEPIQALLLVAGDSGAWEVLSKVMKTS